MTYFPINIVLLPFVVFLVLLKSPRLSDFVLKLQYTLLIIGYCVLGLILSCAILPMLYMKCVLNSVYMLKVNKREKYRGQNFINLVSTIFLGPFIVMGSLVKDLFVLNISLMKTEG